MPQAIAGVTPSQSQEMTVMIVWPSIARLPLGRFLGRLYECPYGFYIFTVGNILALLSAPLAMVLYFLKVLPGIAIRYRLTNRRVVVERGMLGVYERGVELDRFNAIDIEVRPGQAWFDAGDLVFRLDQTETFRLAGVSRPDAFRRTCLKSQQSFTGIRQAVGI